MKKGSHQPKEDKKNISDAVKKPPKITKEDTISYRLTVNKDLWERFKATIPKSYRTINDVILEFIKKRVGE